MHSGLSTKSVILYVIRFGNKVDAPQFLENGTPITGGASFVEASGAIYNQLIYLSGVLSSQTPSSEFDGGDV